MEIALGGGGVGVDLLKKAIDEGWRFYIYGVIHYNDIFAHSEPHVTKYCYTIGAARNEKGDIEPRTGLCDHWNCADDECRTDRDAWIAQLTAAFAKAGKKVPQELLFGSGPKPPPN
jgi:hypothetical protein